MGINRTSPKYNCPDCKSPIDIPVLAQKPMPLYRVVKNSPIHAHPGQDGFDTELWGIALNYGRTFTIREFYAECCRHKKYNFLTVQSRVKKWLKWGKVVPTGKFREPSLITCKFCFSEFNAFSLMGSIKSERKEKTSTKNLELAWPKHKSKRGPEVWKLIANRDGQFTPHDISAKLPKVPFHTIRQLLYKWTKEGKLESPSMGLYMRKRELGEKA